MKNFDEAIQTINPREDYSVKQTADFLGMSYSAILGHIKRGNVPSRKVLGRHFIKGADILKCLTN